MTASSLPPSGPPSPAGVLTPGIVLDPHIALATSVHASPGVYALLLGSGISMPTGIPTGWQVVSDLVARAAAAAKKSADEVEAARADPETWWTNNGDGEPLGYSSLLAALAPTPAARRQLLAGYFEPTDDERDAGQKTPSPAHRAVAELVARGAVRVILTTNFDRLTERALEERGIAPQVISQVAQVPAAMPFAHAKVTIIKLHGDYFDLDQRNTVDELSNYEPVMDALLDRVFDEYGLVVCGWSGDWDYALVAALDRCPRRRFPVFWSSYSRPGPVASRLVASHQAGLIEGEDADQFFGGLVESLRSLDRLAAVPLSRDMAVAKFKRYLADERRRIDVFDVVDVELRKVLALGSDENLYPLWKSGLDVAFYDQQLDKYRQDSDTLLHLLAQGVYHDTGMHDGVWRRALTQITAIRSLLRGGHLQDDLEKLRHYPALLALWVTGVSAVLADREELLVSLLAQIKWREHYGYQVLRPIVESLNPGVILSEEFLKNSPVRKTGPAWYVQSRLLRAECREVFRQLEPSDKGYDRACSQFEALASLVGNAIPDARYPYWPGNWLIDDRTNGVPASLSDLKPRWPDLAKLNLGCAVAEADGAYDELEKETKRISFHH